MSRFVVVPGASELTANARSSMHPIGYRAPLTGHIDADLRNGKVDTAAPITASLEVDLDGLRSTDPHLDGELRRRLDIQRFPRALAVVQHVTASGEDRYRLDGELTLHGATRPLAGEADVAVGDDQLHATGAVTIDIRQFGIKAPRMLMLRVRPEVEIIIDLIANLES